MKKWQSGLCVILFLSVCMASYEGMDSNGLSGETDLVRLLGQPEKKIIKSFGPLSDTLPACHGDTFVFFEDERTKEQAISIMTTEPGFSAMGVAVGDSATALEKLGEPDVVGYPVSMAGDGALIQRNGYWYPDKEIEVNFSFSGPGGISGIDVRQGYRRAERAIAGGLVGQWVNISTGEYVSFFDTGKITISDMGMNEIASGEFMLTEGSLSFTCLYPQMNIRMTAMGDCDISDSRIRCDLTAVYQDNMTGGAVKNNQNNGRLVFELVRQTKNVSGGG